MFCPEDAVRAQRGLRGISRGLWCDMKATQTIKGRISGRFNGLGTVTPEMVEQRAREIALINGRVAEDFSEADLDEARAELTGDFATEEQREEEPGLAAATLRDVVPGTSGHKVAAKLPSDEQRVAEQLVQEGVDEAEHHQMLAGSTTETGQNS
jgi:hypothetical protein